MREHLCLRFDLSGLCLSFGHVDFGGCGCVWTFGCVVRGVLGAFFVVFCGVFFVFEVCWVVVGWVGLVRGWVIGLGFADCVGWFGCVGAVDLIFW
ncbi:MAG: hypothetical protein JSS02_02505 [Planctomycetes bacterium]|nr:hypothetical protein [Planctomycetota bacterium]